MKNTREKKITLKIDDDVEDNHYKKHIHKALPLINFQDDSKDMFTFLITWNIDISTMSHAHCL